MLPSAESVARRLSVTRSSSSACGGLTRKPYKFHIHILTYHINIPKDIAQITLYIFTHLPALSKPSDSPNTPYWQVLDLKKSLSRYSDCKDTQNPQQDTYPSIYFSFDYIRDSQQFLHNITIPTQHLAPYHRAFHRHQKDSSAEIQPPTVPELNHLSRGNRTFLRK